MIKTITADIYFIQLADSTEEFILRKSLFLKKYINFKSYDLILTRLIFCFFNNENTWYKGCSLFSPSTINALENFNKILKSKYLSYKKNNIIKFITKAHDIVIDLNNKYAMFPPNLISMDYDSNLYTDTSRFKLIDPCEDKYIIKKKQ